MAFLSLLASRHVDENSVHDATNNARVISLAASGKLNDADERVRCSALHTLACDRCKEGACKPEEGEVLPKAIRLLARDPDAHVRAMAIEVVGQFVHTNALAAAAVSAAQQDDENSTVRKKAGWYVPGGPIYRRTKPRLGTIGAEQSR